MTESSLFQWVLLPLIIFCARILDVSIDTIRIMLFSRGRRYLVALLGFVQVLIWLTVFRQIILHLSNWICYVAYAGGFATGTFIGMLIEEKLAIGYQVLRVITRKDAKELIGHLKERNYGVTALDGEGATGKVNIIFTIVKRVELETVIEIVKKFNPNAFYTIEDIRSVSNIHKKYKPVC